MSSDQTVNDGLVFKPHPPFSLSLARSLSRKRVHFFFFLTFASAISVYVNYIQNSKDGFLKYQILPVREHGRKCLT